MNTLASSATVGHVAQACPVNARASSAKQLGTSTGRPPWTWVRFLMRSAAGLAALQLPAKFDVPQVLMRIFGFTVNISGELEGEDEMPRFRLLLLLLAGGWSSLAALGA